MSRVSIAIDDTIIERYKLQTEFSPGRSSVVHTTVIYKSSPVSGARRAVEVKTPWRETRELGSGGFGVVSLQRTADGQCRAVKRVLRGGGVSSRTELMALSMALDVSLFPGDRVGQVNSLLILAAILSSIQTYLLNFLDGLRTGTTYTSRRSSSCTAI
jgi:hypothetical protein